jgi:hypothetical protein
VREATLSVREIPLPQKSAQALHRDLFTPVIHPHEALLSRNRIITAQFDAIAQRKLFFGKLL